MDLPKSNFFALILKFATLLQQCGKINLNLFTPTVTLEGFNIFMKTVKDWVFFKHPPPEDFIENNDFFGLHHWNFLLGKGAGSFHIHRKTMKELGALAVLGVQEQPNLAQNLVTHRH